MKELNLILFLLHNCLNLNIIDVYFNNIKSFANYNLTVTPPESVLRVIQVSANKKFTCAIEMQFSAVCWWNSKQNPENKVYTIKGFENGAIRIKTGVDQIVCAESKEKEVKCFYNNKINGADFDIEIQLPENQNKQLIDFSFGLRHYCATNLSHNTACFEYDDKMNIKYNLSKPVPESLITNGKMIIVSEKIACGLSIDNNLMCWRLDNFIILNTISDKQKLVKISKEHFCAINVNDTLECWSDQGSKKEVPSEVRSNNKQLSMSNTHLCTLKQDNSISCWDYYLQSKVQLVNLESFSVGQNHDCHVYSTGRLDIVPNNMGLLIPSEIPEQQLMGARSVSAGLNYTLVIDGSNSINLFWVKPKVGDEFKEQYYNSAGVISAGKNMFCGINKENFLMCWLIEDYKLIHLLIPKKIKKAIKVSAGEDNICVKNIDNIVSCHYYNYELKELKLKQIPMVIIEKSSEVTDVQTFSKYKCALFTDNMMCWAPNKFEKQFSSVKSFSVGPDKVCQVNTLKSLHCHHFESGSDLPVPLEWSKGMKAVKVSEGQSCAINKDDQLACWQDNGQFMKLPKEMHHHHVLEVSAGLSHVCVRTFESRMICWGLEEVD